MCEIHFYLFQDVYDWAGQIRRVDLRKNVEGAVFFLRYSMIENAARFAAAELASENNLRNLSRHDFVERLSYYYDQLNYIHPFREGNGRAQRVFWNRIAHDAGWVLDWREVHGEVNDRACQIGAEHEDLGPLKEMFDAMVQPLSASSEHSLAAEPSSRARLSFPLKSEETAD